MVLSKFSKYRTTKIYYASIINKATIGYFIKLQETTPLVTENIKPEVFFDC